MAQDFYIDPATQDWFLEDGTTIRVCDTEEELVRQRLEINLKMIRGEWFADVNYGVPYFESIYGKRPLNEVDAVFKTTIRRTEGVNSITNYVSTLDAKTRTYKAQFSVLTDTGPIENIEVTI